MARTGEGERARAAGWQELSFAEAVRLSEALLEQIESGQMADNAGATTRNSLPRQKKP